MVLHFSIPDQNTKLAPLTELRPKQLQAWLANLQNTNPQNSTQSILTSLAALNRQPLASDIRLNLLTVHWSAAQNQIDMLQRQLSGSMLPFSEKADTQTRLARDFLIELSYGYKLVLIDDTSTAIPKKQKLDIAQVIYLLLTIQQRIFSLCYEMYALIPDTLWRETHQAFEYAETLGILEKENPTSTDNIINLYQQILLISLADPYHLMQGEITLVQELSRELAPLTCVTDKIANTEDYPLFILDLATDEPASTNKRILTDAEHKTTIRYFDVHQATQQLQTKLTYVENGGAPQEVGLPVYATKTSYRTLLHQLIRSWGNPVTRRFNRYVPKYDEVDLGLGVRTIHALLESKSAKPVKVTPNPAFFTPAPTLRNHYLAKWQVLNVGAQGQALRSKTNTPSHIKVGELISLREHNDGGWQLSIIKWVKSIDAQTLEIGVQFLPPNGSAVEVFNPLSAIKTMQPGILFPANSALNQPNLLLTPHGMYMHNVHIELITTSSHTIKPQTLIMQTQSFDLFEIP
jgi:hypothetical protein